MALKVSISNPTGRKVSFGTTAKPLTIKSSAAATTLDTLADIDLSDIGNLTANTEVEATGATLLYNEETGVFEAMKVWDIDEETQEPILQGGEF